LDDLSISGHTSIFALHFSEINIFLDEESPKAKTKNLLIASVYATLKLRKSDACLLIKLTGKSVLH
jgi:alpha-ketoglutarate-dependent taurine dioxygenase